MEAYVGWECIECNAEEPPTPIDAVCHHCGKPLCRKDQIVIADDAFATFLGEAGRAVHCRACRRRHHRLPGIPLNKERQ